MPRDDQISQRFLDFELRLYRECSEEVRRFDGGYAILNPSIPLVWDANDIVIERRGLGGEEVERIGDEVLGGLGMEHRSLVHADAAESRRLEHPLAKRGWEVERTLYMALRGAPDREATAEVRECGTEEIADLRRALIREDLPIAQPKIAETVEQLLELDRRVGGTGGDRWFVACDDHGKPASACRLLALEGESLGQIEDVATVREARQRGLARATVLAAIRASREAGHETTFIGALEDDWPRLLYARLGFEPVGGYLWFRRRPPGMAPTS